MTETARELTPEEAASAARQRLGRVIAAEGAQILVLLDKNRAAGAPALGDAVIFLNAEGAAIVAMVTALSVPSPVAEGESGEIWIAETEVFGTLTQGGFETGAGRLPSLGDEACAAAPGDLGQIYGADGPGGVDAIALGRSCGDKTAAGVPAAALSRGFGIFGAQGTGKSCALVSILRAMIKARIGVRPIVIDARGEYGASFGRAAVHVTPQAGLLPFWLLTPEELSVALGAATGPLTLTEEAVLRTAYAGARRRAQQRGEGGGAAHAAGLVPYRFSDLSAALEAEGPMSGAAAAGLHARFAAARADERLSLVFGGDEGGGALLASLRDIFGLGGGGGLACVVRTADVPLGLDRLMVCVLARLALVFGGVPGSGKEALFILEDAGRYAGAEEVCALSRHAVEELFRLGPARGVRTVVVSDGPSRLPGGLIAGLGGVVLGPLRAEADRRAAAVGASSRILSALSPQTLRRQEMIVLGGLAALPFRLRLDDLPEAAVPRAMAAKPASRRAEPGSAANGGPAEAPMAAQRSQAA